MGVVPAELLRQKLEAEEAAKQEEELKAKQRRFSDALCTHKYLRPLSANRARAAMNRQSEKEMAAAIKPILDETERERKYVIVFIQARTDSLTIVDSQIPLSVFRAKLAR